jgi:hypothetical protein
MALLGYSDENSNCNCDLKIGGFADARADFGIISILEYYFTDL